MYKKSNKASAYINNHSVTVIPPTPAVENEKEKFDFAKDANSTKTVDTKSVDNLYHINPLENTRRASGLLFVPKLDSKRLSIPVVLIPGDPKSNSKFNSNDSVYLENLYKAASVTSLGNFGNIAAEPMPIIKNKEGKW